MTAVGYNVMYINRSVYNGDGVWTGQMNNFKIYKKLLTVAEIGILFNDNEILPSTVPAVISSTYKSINFLNTGANQT